MVLCFLQSNFYISEYKHTTCWVDKIFDSILYYILEILQVVVIGLDCYDNIAITIAITTLIDNYSSNIALTSLELTRYTASKELYIAKVFVCNVKFC